MTAKTITRRPALGQAWSGDWRARVLNRLHSRGFRSVADFANSAPRASLVALAEELSTDHNAGIDHADVCAEQLARLWREEANRTGPDSIELMARRILVGELHDAIPEGWLQEWPVSDDIRSPLSRFLNATTSWTSHVGQEHEPASDRIFEAMIERGRSGEIPAGWLPSSAEDPILLDLFARYWREPS